MSREDWPAGRNPQPRTVVKTITGFYERVATTITPEQVFWLELTEEEFSALVDKGAVVLKEKPKTL